MRGGKASPPPSQQPSQEERRSFAPPCLSKRGALTWFILKTHGLQMKPSSRGIRLGSSNRGKKEKMTLGLAIGLVANQIADIGRVETEVGGVKLGNGVKRDGNSILREENSPRLLVKHRQ